MLGCLFVMSRGDWPVYLQHRNGGADGANCAGDGEIDPGVSPYPFAMIVAMAASAAFMTPVSSPVNTLVLGPGNYSFSDFVKLGVPFTIIVMAVCVVMIPMLFPF
ncbi:anion permease [Escherichia coli]